MQTFWAWVAGLITITLFSYVYKENRAYRLMEHIYVGCSAGYAISANFRNINNLIVRPLTTQGQWLILIPTILGLMMFTRFFKSVAYLSRWTTSFLVALGTGLALYGIADAQLRTQITATFLPLMVVDNSGGFDLLTTMNNWIMVFGVLSVLVYFFFIDIKNQPVIKAISSGGRYLMMVSFGVAFGNGVMMNMSLLLGCFDTVLGGMLGLIK